MSKLKLVALSLAITLTITACAAGTKGKYTLEELKAGHDSLINAQNHFAFDLFQEIAKSETEENLFVSPYSVALALSMTYNGADNETKDAMAKALHLEGLTLEDVNLGNEIAMDVLMHLDPSVQLSIANSLWARDGKTFKQAFMDVNREYYQAKIEVLDFSKQSAVDTINKWVDRQTKGKITEIIDGPIDPQTILFLINAIYFKGDWTNAFEENRTTDKPFHLDNGQTKQVPMMVQTEQLEYLDGEGFEAVRLPYGNEQLGMLLFLPDEDAGLDAFIPKVTAENWNAWLSGFSKGNGTVELPRFTMEFELSLNEVLKQLGMEVAFDDTKADFSKMVDIPPIAYIADVKHKTFIDVNEKGSEAAAVTKVEIRTESAVLESFHLKFDRPFFFAIHDRATNTILFMGTLMDP